MTILEELGIDPEQIDKESVIGHPRVDMVNGVTVIDVPVRYFYKGEKTNFTIRIVPDGQISTVTDKQEGADGRMVTSIIKQGMNRSEIEEFFPPAKGTKAYDFGLKAVIRSIIFESYMKREFDYLPEGNVRGFWYTHLIHMILSILGIGETDSVKSTINQAWEDLIVSGLVTYDGLNIRSDSESSTHSVVKDSPFSNLIIAVEKDDKFESMKWMPRLFNCTLMTAGGQPSRANARRFVMDMRDIARVDLNQTFYMCTISDLDPAGYYIQESFKNQLEKAISYYGGTGKIEIRRLFVGKNQVTQELLDHDAVPCYDKAKGEKAKKSENTKWEYFCRHTDGGIYKKVPRSVAISLGAISPTEHIGESHVKVRAKLELNAFPDEIINRRVVRELLHIIEQTSDESLVMIPEIMRIFEEERLKAIEEVYNREHKAQIQPLIADFLKSIDQAKSNKLRTTWAEETDVNNVFDAEVDETSEPFDEEIQRLSDEADERVPDELAKKDEYEDAIAELEQKKDDIEEEIREKTQDLLDQIGEQETEKEEALKPIEEERTATLEVIEFRGDYRKEELEKFKREKETVFNPLEIALREDIKNQLAQENLEFFFDDLEGNSDTAGHIAKLLMNPEELLENGLACLQHDKPAFKEQDLLQKASAEKRENVEAHRRGFTSDFTDSMRTIVHTRAEEKGLKYEIGEMGELEDFTDELTDLEAQIEADIDEGKYLIKEEKPDKDDDEDGDSGDDDDDDYPDFTDKFECMQCGDDASETDESTVEDDEGERFCSEDCKDDYHEGYHHNCARCDGGFREKEEGAVEDEEGNWFCSDDCKAEYHEG